MLQHFGLCTLTLSPSLARLKSAEMWTGYFVIMKRLSCAEEGGVWRRMGPSPWCHHQAVHWPWTVQPHDSCLWEKYTLNYLVLCDLQPNTNTKWNDFKGIILAGIRLVLLRNCGQTWMVVLWLRQSWRGFLGGPVVKNLPCSAENMGLIPGLETKIPHAAKQLSPHAIARHCMPQPRPDTAK